MPLGALGENLFPCLFHLLEDATFLRSWPVPLSLQPATAGRIFLRLHLSALLICLPLPLLRTLVIILGPPR